MRVSLVVSSSKYTGAAAIAENWWRALGEAGADAELTFVRGANLERRLTGAPAASPSLVKERRPSDVLSNFKRMKTLAAKSDVMMSFLPHDHLLAVTAGVHLHTCLVRAFRHPRHVRTDPFHLFLARRSHGALAPFSALTTRVRRLTGSRPVDCLPAPVEDRFCPIEETDFRRDDDEFPGDGPVLGMVGKLAAHRGFELLLDAAANTASRCRVVIVGHGELQPALEERARNLGIAERVFWTGKREKDLPRLYRAMDVVLFAAPGSDWGHRMISEAQAVGRPVVAVDHPGVEDLVNDGLNGLVAPPNSSAVAAAVDRLAPPSALAPRLVQTALADIKARRFLPVGERLLAFLDLCLKTGRSNQ